MAEISNAVSPLESQPPTLTHSMEKLLDGGERGPGCLASPIRNIHKILPQKHFKVTIRPQSHGPTSRRRNDRSHIAFAFVPPVPPFWCTKLCAYHCCSGWGTSEPTRAHNLFLFLKSISKLSFSPLSIFPRWGISKSTVGTVYAVAAFSTVFPQSSAPPPARGKTIPNAASEMLPSLVGTQPGQTLRTRW